MQKTVVKYQPVDPTQAGQQLNIQDSAPQPAATDKHESETPEPADGAMDFKSANIMFLFAVIRMSNK